MGKIAVVIVTLAALVRPAAAERRDLAGILILPVAYESPGMIPIMFLMHRGGLLIDFEWGLDPFHRRDNLAPGDQANRIMFSFSLPNTFDPGFSVGAGLDIGGVEVKAGPGIGGTGASDTIGAFGYNLSAGYADGRFYSLTARFQHQLFGAIDRTRKVIEIHASASIDGSGWLLPYVRYGYGWYELEGGSDSGSMFMVGLSLAKLFEFIPLIKDP